MTVWPPSRVLMELAVGDNVYSKLQGGNTDLIFFLQDTCQDLTFTTASSITGSQIGNKRTG